MSLLLRFQVEAFMLVGLGFAFLGLVLGFDDSDWKRRCALVVGGLLAGGLTALCYGIAIAGGLPRPS